MKSKAHRRDVAVTTVALLVVLLVGLMPVPAHSAPLDSPQQSTDGYCGCGTHVRIIPAAPKPDDPIQVVSSGEWPNSCAPSFQFHQIAGNIIRVDAAVEHPIGTICADWITPWELVEDVGTLPSGAYQVELDITWPDSPPTLCATTPFQVGPIALITTVYYDTYLTGEPDEAFRLSNISGLPIDLTIWTVSDGEGTITLTGALASGASIWIAKEADDFTLEFGFTPDYEYGADTDPAVPNLATSGTFDLTNTGDELTLREGNGAIVDSVVYEAGDPTGTGWYGPGIYPYTGDSVGMERFAEGTREEEGFGLEGQILYRKMDQSTGLPVADTNTASDWAQAMDDNINGKKVMYPGWDLERYFFTKAFTETATVTYAVAPDNIYETVVAEIRQATTSIYYEGYTFNNAHLGDAIVAQMAAHPGMTVTILLEGGPGGGITAQEKWICQQIENAGGEIYFIYTDDAADVHDRYAYQHGKWMILDEETLLTGSENLNYSSMPADDKTDGTSGHRGVWLITDAPTAVAHALDVFRHDLDPAHHRDIVRWTTGDPTYGAPPPGFTPDYSSGGSTYPVRFSTPFTVSGEFAFEMVQSPDNSLRDMDSLLGMVARAGSGDTVLVQQLYEYTYWGATASNVTDDPNVRLETYIAAARRGARVRIMLDAAFDDPGDVRGNSATCTYVRGIATAEGLDLECKLADPAGTGIHNKIVLVEAGGRGYIHTGSINGSDNSSKANREFAVQVQSDAAYAYLAGVFWSDWGTYQTFLPVVVRGYTLPIPQPDPYIQALVYDSADEWIQITNPGVAARDMTGWRIQSVAGDQWYDFPAGYSLDAGASVYVHSGPGGYSDPPAHLLWTNGYIWNNSGDEAILYDVSGKEIDRFCYGSGCQS